MLCWSDASRHAARIFAAGQVAASQPTGDQLASPAVDARLGGIYALQRIAAESPRDRLTIRNVLAAFVRHHDFCSAQPPSQQCTAPIRDMYLARTATPLPTDVEAAFSAALSLTAAGDDFADLSQTRFPRVVFPDKGPTCETSPG